jgi:hypothetical protein
MLFGRVLAINYAGQASGRALYSLLAHVEESLIRKRDVVIDRPEAPRSLLHRLVPFQALSFSVVCDNLLNLIKQIAF